MTNVFALFSIYSRETLNWNCDARERSVDLVLETSLDHDISHGSGRAVRGNASTLAARLHPGFSLRGNGVGISEATRLDVFHGVGIA
jgi:hypothetical protein